MSLYAFFYFVWKKAGVVYDQFLPAEKLRPVLSQFSLVFGLHLVHLCLNQRSNFICDFMSGKVCLQPAY